LLKVAKAVAEGIEMFWPDVHSEEISCMISGSDMAGRSRAASSGSAYMTKPALALAGRMFVVVAGGQFQVHLGLLLIAGLVFEPDVRDRDLAIG